MSSRRLCKVISMVLTVMLVFYTVLPVASKAVQEDSLEQYISECMMYYLLGQGLDIQDSTYFISQGVEIINGTDSNKRMHFLFLENECVGELTITEINNEYVSSFMYGDIPAITNAYCSDLPVGVCVIGNATYIYTTNSLVLLSGSETAIVNIPEAIINQATYLSLVPVCVDQATAVSAQARSAEQVLLDVPVVSNGLSPSGKGLCWAACIASIGSYKTSVETAYTALQIYESVRVHCNVPNWEEPVGIPYYVTAGFNMLGLDFDKYNQGLVFSDIKLFIQNDMPIQASIKSEDETYIHDVVICGYNVYNSTTLLRIMDPNYPYLQTVYLGYGATDFTYIVGEANYTDWFRRYNEQLYYETA